MSLLSKILGIIEIFEVLTHQLVAIGTHDSALFSTYLSCLLLYQDQS
jgi:hypothetical protein